MESKMKKNTVHKFEKSKIIFNLRQARSYLRQFEKNGIDSAARCLSNSYFNQLPGKLKSSVMFC